MGGETFWSLSVDLLSVLQRPCLSLQDPLLALCPRVAESENSFEVVSSAGDSVASGRSRVFGISGSDRLDFCYLSCFLVVARFLSEWPVPDSQAWQAGQWARAVLDQRALSPNRSEPLDLRCMFFVVLRCEGLDCPVVFHLWPGCQFHQSFIPKRVGSSCLLGLCWIL